MIKVAFINHHGAVPGGSERSLEAYLRRAPQDVMPHLVLFEDGAYADHIRSLNIPVYVVTASSRLMSVTREHIHAGDAVDGIRHAVRLAKLLKFCGIDVVVTNSMKAHIVGTIAARMCGIPAVTWWHDLPDGFALKVLRTLSATCASERVGCSRAVVRHFALGHTTALVPAIDLQNYAEIPSKSEARAFLGLPQDKLIFSIIGRVARWKGQDRFISAASRVCARTECVHFAIVGSPTFSQDREFAPELLELTAELGISQHVSFIPWLDDPKLAYAASDLVCNASSAEPFGRTLAEAAACGVPSICFDDGGAHEAILPGVTGTVVPAGDVEAFAAAMAAYAADPTALRRAGIAARVYVRRHDADALALSFYAIVRRACKPNALMRPRSMSVRIASPITQANARTKS
jgi:glycosyltransferase involved in cell wall biosynthesis